MICIEKTQDCSVLFAEVNRIAAEKWGANVPASCRHPIKDGDIMAREKNDPWYAGKWIINAKANVDFPPQVVGQDRQPVVDRTQIYAGCYGHFALNFYAYDQQVNKGVSAGLTAFMKTADGERLDNRADANQLFAAVAGAPAPVAAFGQPAAAAPAASFGQPAAAAPAAAVGVGFGQAAQNQPISFG
jgi:hypothetical protein